MTDHSLIETLLAIILTLFASSGFWALLEFKLRNRKQIDENRECQTELLKGLAHDRIVYLGMKYIERGWLTHSEYENLTLYLYKPYLKMNGNGSAQRIMSLVDDLPIKHMNYDSEEEVKFIPN